MMASVANGSSLQELFRCLVGVGEGGGTGGTSGDLERLGRGFYDAGASLRELHSAHTSPTTAAASAAAVSGANASTASTSTSTTTVQSFLHAISSQAEDIITKLRLPEYSGQVSTGESVYFPVRVHALRHAL